MRARRCRRRLPSRLNTPAHVCGRHHDSAVARWSACGTSCRGPTSSLTPATNSGARRWSMQQTTKPSSLLSSVMGVLTSTLGESMGACGVVLVDCAKRARHRSCECQPPSRTRACLGVFGPWQPIGGLASRLFWACWHSSAAAEFATGVGGLDEAAQLSRPESRSQSGDPYL